jgi:hypothetical protein
MATTEEISNNTLTQAGADIGIYFAKIEKILRDFYSDLILSSSIEICKEDIVKIRDSSLVQDQENTELLEILARTLGFGEFNYDLFKELIEIEIPDPLDTISFSSSFDGVHRGISLTLDRQLSEDEINTSLHGWQEKLTVAKSWSNGGSLYAVRQRREGVNRKGGKQIQYIGIATIKYDTQDEFFTNINLTKTTESLNYLAKLLYPNSQANPSLLVIPKLSLNRSFLKNNGWDCLEHLARKQN